MPKRILQGIVVSHKSDKTIVVSVERRFIDPLYKKIVRRRKNYHTHDAENRYREGDRVRIQESRPLSKRKRWIVIE